ncbi:hypothetical protein [Novipirellula caenicola]|uniref:Uncharacterized protein n=1 Tax=Novipirellula caenicola TaxID=1536901 RepID=A0ABP9VLJ1_9BACT
MDAVGKGANGQHPILIDIRPPIHNPGLTEFAFLLDFFPRVFIREKPRSLHAAYGVGYELR